MNAELDQVSRPDAKHVVRFYDNEEVLVAELTDYAAAALRSRDAFVTIATPAHFEALRARLYGRGLDADTAIADGRWLHMDCGQTLDTLLRDGMPDAAAFAEALQAPLVRISARHHGVRAFGEMVAKLCESGNHAGAIRLEELWNGLLEVLPIALLCAYPLASFAGEDGRKAFARICAEHGQVLQAKSAVRATPGSGASAQAPQPNTDARHVARFYEDDASLIAEMAEFALPALRSDGTFVCIATPLHRDALQAALRECCIDVDAAIADGRWVQLDCADTLRSLTRDGETYAAAFAETLEAPLRALCHQHRQVRVFGEMVAMQCEAGDYAGAVRLESLGHELVERLPVTLLCAYPVMAFVDPRTRPEFVRICEEHDQVLPAQPSVSGKQPERTGLITMLQQHAAALEEEVRRRVKLEDRLKQSERELRDEVDVLETLAGAGIALIGEQDPGALVRRIVDTAVRLTAAQDGGYVRLSAGAEGEHAARSVVGLSGDALARFGDLPLAAITELFQPIFRGEPVVRCSDLLDERSGVPPNQRGDFAQAPTLRSFLAMPVLMQTGAVQGALFLGHPDSGVFGKRDELILTGIAAHATFAIDNARLLEAGRQWRRDLQSAVAQRSEELRLSELHLATLLAGITDYAIMLLDSKGRVLTWNTGGERIFGYAAEEILGSHFSRFYTQAELDDGAPQRAARDAGERGKHETEAWRTRKDGTRFWASAMLMPIRDGAGCITGYAKVIRDVTAAKVAEERLQQTQRMEIVGQLTGGIAHDFNNLLTIILGNIDAVLRLHPDEPEIRTAAERAANAAERAATLTRQLLAFSRRQPLNPKPVNVTMLLAGMSDMLQRALGENIRVRTTFSGNWPCEVDAHQLESAILNLAINASDAMPGGGDLTLDVSNEHLDDQLLGDDRISGDYVVIAIIDSGTGMPANVLERACEPFFTTKPLGRGTGLGLSQVYGFVRQSGGRLTLSSAADAGTTIRIFLPRSREGNAASVDVAEPAPPPRGKETVLVVEDEAGVRRYCAEQLRELGYTVLEAGDASNALHALDEYPGIELLLTDVGLPVTNGGELAKRARAQRPDLAVLFMSGYPRGIVQQRGQLQSDVELLAKPYTRMQLAQRVRALLDARQPQAETTCLLRVLLLEDDASLRQTMSLLLREFGLDTVEAGNLTQMRAAIADGPTPDLAIVDVNLGSENGMDAIREMRMHNPDLPVIITSGYGHAVQRCGDVDDGRTAILPKPYSLRALKRTIASLGLGLHA